MESSGIRVIRRIGRHQFSGQDVKRSWGGLDETQSIKVLAKMFREITHMKPPRGRQGRLLPQGSQYGYTVVGEGSNEYFQRQVRDEDVLSNIENRSQAAYNLTYLPASRDNANESDISRLQAWHKKHQSKLAVSNTVSGLSDLIQGLMGLGLKDVEYNTVGYRDTKYQATMRLDNFIITIQERGAND